MAPFWLYLPDGRGLHLATRRSCPGRCDLPTGIPKAKAWINLIGVILFLTPGCYLVIQTSTKFALSSWSILEGSPDPGGIPFRFIIKSAIPVGFTLMFLQGIALGIESFFTIIGIDIKEGAST